MWKIVKIYAWNLESSETLHLLSCVHYLKFISTSGCDGTKAARPTALRDRSSHRKWLSSELSKKSIAN